MAKKIKLTRNTWIMSGPGKSFEVLLKLKKGDIFSVTEKTINSDGQGWWKLANRSGYVISSAIKFVDASANSSAAGNGGVPKSKPEASAPPDDPQYQGFNKHEGNSRVTGTLGKDDTDGLPKMKFQEKMPDSYYANYSFVEQALKTVRQNHNLMMDDSHIDKIRKAQLQRFNRYKLPYPDIELTKSFGYVFFVRPNLNLFELGGKTLRREIDMHPFFHHIWKSDPDILKSLTSTYSSQHKFIPLLSNHAMSFEIQDEFIKTEEYGETYTGHKTRYARNDVESKSSGSVSVQFSDDVYLNVFNMIKAWILYMSNVYRGEFKPRDEDIFKKVIDYASAAYYFLCGPDGETILFWSKYFGLMPTTSVSSIFSYSKGNHVKLPEFSVNFDYTSKEDMNPLTFYEFNKLSDKNYKYKRIISEQIAGSGKTMAGAPFVETAPGNGRYEFKLKFRV